MSAIGSLAAGPLLGSGALGSHVTNWVESGNLAWHAHPAVAEGTLMWWKLIGLFVLTAALVVALIPIRTHAIAYDPMSEPPPERGSLADVFSNMYLTPGTVLLILCIVAVAGFVASKIVRGHW